MRSCSRSTRSGQPSASTTQPILYGYHGVNSGCSGAATIANTVWTSQKRYSRQAQTIMAKPHFGLPLTELKNISNVRTTQHWGAFALPLLPWKNNKYYTSWVCVCNLSYPACNAHAPYYIDICGPSSCTIFFRIIPQTARFSGEGGNWT
jgi:hypothetical protein